MLQGYYSLNYSYSPLDGSVVLRVLKSSSFRYSELSCVCVCVGYWLLTPVCYSPSKPAVPKHPLCALQNTTFWGKKDKNKMLPDFKKPQGTYCEIQIPNYKACYRW